MGKAKTMNPDSVSLEDIRGMGAGEFRQWTFLTIHRLDDRTRRIDQRLWWVLGSVVTLGVVAILAAVL